MSHIQRFTANIKSQPSLVEVDKENDVVTKTGETMRERHVNNEGKYIIDEGVEGLQGTQRNKSQLNF